MRNGGILCYGSTNLRVATAAKLPGAGAGIPYAFALHAAHGLEPYLWTVSSGAPPAGLQLETNGILSGGATMMGEQLFSARVTDAIGATAEQSFSITVVPEPAALLWAAGMLVGLRRVARRRLHVGKVARP